MTLARLWGRGPFRSSILTVLSLGLLMAGVVARAAGVAGDQLFFSGLVLGFVTIVMARNELSGASWKTMALLTIHAVICLFIVGTLDRLLQHHRYRIDVTESHRFVLSPATKGLLAQLRGPLKVTVAFRSNSPGRFLARDLLATYRHQSPQVEVRFMDPDLKPSLANRFPGAASGALIVQYGEREKLVRRPTERHLSLAIHALLGTNLARVGFLTGQGEATPSDRGPLGYSLTRSVMEHENYKVVEIAPGSGIPKDLRVLVAPYPRVDPPETVMQSIAAFQKAGGSVLALLEPGEVHPRMRQMLQSWGVTWAGAQVYDLARFLQGDPGTAVVSKELGSYRSHPITEGLASTLFPGVSPLGFGPDAERRGWKPLATVSQESRSTLPDGKPGPTGELVVAAAARLDNAGRVAVLGDGDFMTNASLAKYPVSQELMMALINWLAERDELLGQWPDPPGPPRLILADRHYRALTAVTALGMPCLLLIIALYCWLEARRS